MPIQLPFLPRRRDYPPDLWTKCPSCEEMLYNKQLDRNLRVCPKCGHHFRLRAAARIRMLLDPDSFVERDAGLESLDPLGFTDQKSYPDRLATARVATGLGDAAVWGLGRIEGLPVVACVMDFAFMGGSFGSVVGEKVARAAEAAVEGRLPLVIVSASGGAPDAGGHRRPHAAGEDVRRAQAPLGSARPVHQHPHRPHHRRLLGVVGLAR